MDDIIALCRQHPSPVYEEILNKYIRCIQPEPDNNQIPIRSENNYHIWAACVQLRKEHTGETIPPIIEEITRVALMNR